MKIGNVEPLEIARIMMDLIEPRRSPKVNEEVFCGNPGTNR